MAAHSYTCSNSNSLELMLELKGIAAEILETMPIYSNHFRIIYIYKICQIASCTFQVFISQIHKLISQRNISLYNGAITQISNEYSKRRLESNHSHNF